MAILVQKYGGSSVGDVEKIRKVAEAVRAKRAEGYQLVVVVSAMGDTTDELLGLAKQVSPSPPRRELDMLLTCGERISMALLSMALQELGVPAISFTGSQSGIITDDNHAQAKIIEVRPSRILEELREGKTVIVAGFQGVSGRREVTTLGRGGSDTTAVALAAALGAEACEICSDVDGVFSADPSVVVSAHKLASVTYEEMQELSHAGARVLNAQAVEFAKLKGIIIHAKTAHGEGSGTRVQAGTERGGRASPVTAVASDMELAVLSCQGSAALESLTGFLQKFKAKPRLLVMDLLGAQGRALVLLPVQDLHGVQALQLPGVEWHPNLATVTCVGAGIGTDFGLVCQIHQLAERLGTPPVATLTSPLQICLVVKRDQAADLTRALHTALVASASL